MKNDIDNFSNRKWISAKYKVGNLQISEPSLGILEKIQCSLVLLKNIIV